MTSQQLYDSTMIRVKNLLQTKPQRPLVYFTEDQPLDEALQVLAKNDIHCAPVYDDSTRKLRGVIDILDATRFVINLYNKGGEEPVSPHFFDTHTWKNYATKLSCGLHTVKDILDSAVTTKHWDTVSLDDSFLKVLQLFAQGMHILLVTQQGSQVVNVLSQLDVVRFIADESVDLHEINFARYQSLQDLSFVKSGINQHQDRICCVDASQSAVTAFYLMHKNGLTSICVSDHGQLVGNVSPIDLEGFLEEEFQHLGVPVLDYVKYARRKRNKQPSILITCSASDVLLELLRRLSSGNVHRAYIVNESKEPTGFVSVEDIFEKLAKMALEHQRTSGSDLLK